MWVCNEGGIDGVRNSEVDWKRIYGRLATINGYTYSEINDLYFPDLLEIVEYWAIEPPVHDMVRWYLGLGKTPVEPPSGQPRTPSGSKPADLNLADASFMGATGYDNAKTFDNLPPHVQAMLTPKR